MAKKDVNIAAALRDVLKNVPNSDTSPAREQIEYIDIDLIDDDPNNFYELSDLDELAANIEFFGLQQPIRVRKHPEAAGRYIIVSGHRRRAAIRQLVEDGRDDLRQISCIIERAEGSAALQELRLIYANSDTRRMTSAEISKEAERVESLLYQLKEEGYEFPGRMRDHVAEACKVSKSKLARLKVIRENLVSEWYAHYSTGDLAESTAYTISQMPAAHQMALYEAIVQRKNRDLKRFYESEANRFGEKMSKAEGKQCPKKEDGPCDNVVNKLKRICNRQDDYMLTTPCAGCCAKCEYLISCGYSCDLCSREKQEAKDAKKAAKEEAKAEEERRKLEAAQRDQDIIRFVSRLWDIYDRRKEELGFDDDAYMDAIKIKSWQFHRDKTLSANSYTPVSIFAFDLIKIRRAADFLGLSVDYLLGRTDNPKGIDTEPSDNAWRPLEFADGTVEEPTRSGKYYCRFDCDGAIINQLAWWDGICGTWAFKDGGTKIDAKCLGWFPLPEDDEE